MKRLTKTLAIIASIFISGTVFASGNLNVSIIQGASDEAIVNISNAVKSVYQIEIKNDRGDVIYYKETKSPSKTYQNVYDFSELQDGNYIFSVKLDKELSETDLHIKNGEVEVVKQEKELHPYFAYSDDLLKLSYLNFDQNNVKLYVYKDGSDKAVFQKDLGSDFAMHEAIDFSKLKTGHYDAVLVGDNDSYEYELKVN